MTLVLGIDVGGTKTQLRVASAHSIVIDQVVPSTGWSTHPGAEPGPWLAEKVRCVQQALKDAGRGQQLAQVVVGAHGCETSAHARALGAELSALLALPCTVVNDAQLIVPAAGLKSGIGLIAGTGAVVVGSHAESGEFLSAGGWGWVLGDEGSASALVREAARAVLRAADAGAAPDPLAQRLMHGFEVSDLHALAVAMSWDGGVETWAPHAPAVFAAAEAGSVLASQVIAAGGAALAELIASLRSRGAAGNTVVAAGGVITHQPGLQEAVRSALDRLAPGMRLTVLNEPPVAGAIALALDALEQEAA